MLTWQAAGGFSINAAVRVEGRDRAGRERLIRYCARPPFALERLTIERVRTPILADNARAGAELRRVLYRLPRAAPDGRTVLALSPIEFLQALAHLIPPPRVHRHRYHGVLAPHARLRPAITAWAQQAVAPQPAPAEPTPSSPDFDTADPASRRATPPAAPSSQPSATPLNLSAPSSIWARLLARIYEGLPLICPACGGELRIIAFLTPPEPVTAILDPGSPRDACRAG